MLFHSSGIISFGIRGPIIVSFYISLNPVFSKEICEQEGRSENGEHRDEAANRQHGNAAQRSSAGASSRDLGSEPKEQTSDQRKDQTPFDGYLGGMLNLEAEPAIERSR